MILVVCILLTELWSAHSQFISLLRFDMRINILIYKFDLRNVLFIFPWMALFLTISVLLSFLIGVQWYVVDYIPSHVHQLLELNERASRQVQHRLWQAQSKGRTDSFFLKLGYSYWTNSVSREQWVVLFVSKSAHTSFGKYVSKLWTFENLRGFRNIHFGIGGCCWLLHIW